VQQTRGLLDTLKEANAAMQTLLLANADTERFDAIADERQARTLFKYSVWGFLCDGYNSDTWYWEGCTMWRRAFIYAIIFYAPTSVNSRWQMLLLAFIYIPAGLLHHRYRPFRDKSLDFVEATSISSSIVMLLMAGYVHGMNTAGDWTSELDANGTWSTDVAAIIALLALIWFFVVWFNAALNLSREDNVMSDEGNFFRGGMKALLCCWTQCICSRPNYTNSRLVGHSRIKFYLRDLCEYFKIGEPDTSDSESEHEDLDEEAADVFLFEQMDPPLRTPRNGSEDGIELIEISSTQYGNSTSALADVNSNTGSGEVPTTRPDT